LEIEDYLLAIRRRLWVPVLVPVAAVLLTAIFLYLQPETYQASATVVVPSLSARGYSTSAATQYFSSFKDVLTSPPLLTQISGQTGEPKSNLAAGLTASTTTASSNIITVTYTGPNKNRVVPVVTNASMDALDALLEPQRDAAQRAVVSGQDSLTAANQKVNTLRTSSGHQFPDKDYQIQVQELSALEVQLTQARLAGDQTRVNSLSQVISDRTKALALLAPIVIQYEALIQQQTAAATAYDRALTDFNNVSAEMASNHDAGAVSANFSGHVSRVNDILKYSAVAAGVALLLSLAFIVFMEFLRPASVAGAPPLRGRRLAAIVPAVIAGGTDRPAEGADDGAPTDAPDAWPATWKSGPE
jgi:uncharacterized protein involved in exopolysaccharide biosynthesis